MNKLTESSRRPERAGTLPKARIKKGKLSWFVWAFPIAAAIFFGVLIYEDALDKTRTVTVDFKNVDGVDDQGNTMVRCRGATVGTVKKVILLPNHEWARLTITFRHGQENLKRAGALFWIVRPQVGAGMVRGLETVMSGSFVQERPGDGAVTNQFVGVEEPPPVELPGKALDIRLLSPDLSSLQEESPIFYRGIQIGEVTTYQLAEDAQSVVIGARIREEYAPLVRENSIFWNAGGVDVHFGLMHGLDVRAESAKALISGAVEMATPTEYGPAVKDGQTYGLQAKAQEVWQTWNPKISLQLPPEAANRSSISAKEVPAAAFHR
jgi:paraquat-inducible protein B